MWKEYLDILGGQVGLYRLTCGDDMVGHMVDRLSGI